MRLIADIFDTLETEDILQSSGVITIEPDYYLNATAKQVGTSDKGPLRWFQREDDSQTELIVPNVRTININRSIDSDAATMNFVMVNQQIPAKETSVLDGQFGEPGYYTFDYGESDESQSRWNQVENAWNGLIIPNALFRTFQGFGAGNITTQEELQTAISNNLLVQTGTWLADTIEINNNGDIRVSCRDMMKLLIEQPCFPPLIPSDRYPLEYHRWNDETFETAIRRTANFGSVPLTYKDSSGDRWYGCLVDDAQILTRHGWKDVHSFSMKDEIIGINPTTGKSEWQKVQAIHKYDVTNEEMFGINHRAVDAVTTMNHRWIVKKNASADYGFTMSMNFGSGWFIPKAAEVTNVESPHQDDFVELVAWIMSEGSFDFGFKIYQSESYNPDLCSRIEKLLYNMFGPPGTMSKSKYHKEGDPLWSICKSVRDNGSVEMKYSLSSHLNSMFNNVIIDRQRKVVSCEFISSLTAEQSKLFVEVSILGDGYDVSATNWNFSQAIYERIQPFEMAAIQAGLAVKTMFIEDEGIWRVSVSEDKTAQIKKARHIYSTVYSGVVWCPTVKYGNFLTRRNGTVYYTGNSNASIHGHRPTDSLDGNTSTWAMSVGNGHPSKSFATDYFEYETGGPISAVYIHPWMGNYEMFVSILENGVWQGDSNNVIFYDHTPLLSSQPSALNPDTGADIPYVAKFGVPWEEGQWYELPRLYDSQRVRITFRNQQKAQWGPFYYRCGIREITARGGDGVGGLSIPQAMSIKRVPTKNGYYIMDHTGNVTPLGEGDQFVANSFRGHTSHSVSMDPTPSGLGYFTLDSNGTVWAHGDAFTQAGSTLLSEDKYAENPSAYTVLDPGPPREVYAAGDGLGADVEDLKYRYRSIVSTYTGDGYWLLGQDWSNDDSRSIVEAHGDATLYYDNSTDPFWNIEGYDGVADAASHPSAYGFWAVSEFGFVYEYGSCVHYGNMTSLLSEEKIVSITPTPTGLGYYLLGSFGTFGAFGDADSSLGDSILQLGENERNNAISSTQGRLQEYAGLTLSPGGTGGWLMRRSGEVFPLGDATFFGSLTGLGFKRSTGNYEDYSDIVRDLVMWAGWYLYEDTPGDPLMFGGIETTGAHAGESPIGADFFDKKPVIDPINALKEIVGYITYCDVDGSFHWRSPNFWSIGNFDENGNRITFMPEIDERITLIDYSVATSDEAARSEVIISSTQPERGNFTTETTRIIPPDANLLKGMVKPAFWTNENFINPDERDLMAELISLHIWFQRRQGSITAVANPCLQVDDQIRVYERTTGESYVHYIRGIATSMDRVSGSYTMNITTHWLGSYDNWVIDREGLLTEDGFRISISDSLVEYIDGFKSGDNSGINGVGAYTINTTSAPTDPESDEAEGGGPGE